MKKIKNKDYLSNIFACLGEKFIAVMILSTSKIFSGCN